MQRAVGNTVRRTASAVPRRTISCLATTTSPTSRTSSSTSLARTIRRHVQRRVPIASTSTLRSFATVVDDASGSGHRTAETEEEPFNLDEVERASDEVDVCIVGGGPAGLSAAIRLMQLAKEQDKEIRVVVLEKGGEIGQLLSVRMNVAF